MPQKEKKIHVDSRQTSSAATNYGDADESWLSKIQGTINWIKIPQIDPGKMFESFKSSLLKWLNGDLLREVKNTFSNWIKEKFLSVKKAVSTQINSIISVGGKFIGQWNTAKGQGLALFGAVSTALLGGAVLMGAGPEMITGMLRLSQLTYSLNLKETDAQINAQIQGNITSLYATSGEVLGQGLASFVSGGVFRIPRVQINLTKVTILWRSLNEESRLQMFSQLKALARNAFFGGLKILRQIFYRDTRKWLKNLAQSNPNHPLIKLIPGGAETVKKWGAGGEPWSLSLYVQKKIEELQKKPEFKNIGTFLENFIEGFGEGIQEFLPDLVRQPVT
jgi:hypothetical protein